MVLTTSAPINQALVATLRANGTLYPQLLGGIHEGFAPLKVKYPLLTYQLIYAPYRYLWGSALIVAGFDVRCISEDSVEAGNLDALVMTTLNDAALSVTGQTTLYCRRTADLSSPDTDERGRKIYMRGGSYEIWTAQAN